MTSPRKKEWYDSCHITGDVANDVHRQHRRNARPLHGILFCQSCRDLLLCISNADRQDTKQEMNKIWYVVLFVSLLYVDMKSESLDFRHILAPNLQSMLNCVWVPFLISKILKNTGYNFQVETSKNILLLSLSPFPFWINVKEEYILSAFCMKIVTGMLVFPVS